MKILRGTMYRRLVVLLFGVIFFSLCACGKSIHHCYLCQGIAYPAPCIVDLFTGDVAELSVETSDKAVIWQVSGSVRVIKWLGLTRAYLPIEKQPVNMGLFCDDCLAAIDKTENQGFVLADLRDLENVQVFSLQDGQSYTLESYGVTITSDGEIAITVFAENN